MSLALLTTLALAMHCPYEVMGFKDAPDGIAKNATETLGLSSVMPASNRDVRSHHLPGKESLSSPFPKRRAALSSFPRVPTVPTARPTALALSEAPLIGESASVIADADKAEWADAGTADLADERELIMDAVPADEGPVDAVEADALGLDDLEIGVEAVIPPPVPIEEIQADLLEVLGLDSQVPDAPALPPREVPPWAATIYGGRFTRDDLGPALIGNLSGFEDSALVGFGLARTLTGRRPLTLEAEAQILQHFGNQGHSEGTIALVLRWHDFPWDDKIDTTFAIGEGLSFATSVPVLEIDRNGRSTQLLNYLLFELTFALPQEPDWQFVGRLHHRSGVYGLFDGVGSGSNVYSAGIRRRF